MSRTLLVLLIIATLVIGVGMAVTQRSSKPAKPAAKPAPSKSTKPASTGTKTTPAEVKFAAPTQPQIDTARKGGKVRIKLDTTKGVIVLELDGQAAPIAVANFLNLVKAGFYTGMPFHRVEPGFVIQAGDPTLVKRPPVGYTIPDEKSPYKHDKKGVIAMARLSRGPDMIPNSASTQFYITLGPAPHLDRMGGFAVFGQVVEGTDVLDKIRVNDKINTATVVEKKPVTAKGKEKREEKK